MTPTVSTSVVIDAPRGVVWGYISDLRGHPEWMTDARELVFETDQTSGVGTRMRVATVIGPIRSTDVIEVIGWDDERSLSVHHSGVVTGVGTLRLDAVAGGTRVTWTETLRFPWYLGGPITALGAIPVLSVIWGRNLTRFKQMVRARLP